MSRQPHPAPAFVPISLTAKLLAAGIVCCTLEGAVRKWLLPNSAAEVQAITYFAKDLFWILAAVAASVHKARSWQGLRLRSPFLLGAALVVVGIVVHLVDAALVGGVLSVKAMIIMPLLALVIAPAIRRTRDIEFLGMTIGVLCVGVALLGALQFNAPPSHFLNQQVDFRHSAIEQESNIRASGPFVFISGMSHLSILGTWVGCLFIFSRPKVFAFGIIFLVAALACAAAALTRNGLFSSLIILLGAIVLSRNGLWLAAIFAAMVLMVSPMISVDAITEGEGSLATATFRRHAKSDSDSMMERIQMYSDQGFDAMELTPDGIGIGRCQSYEWKKAVAAGEKTPGAWYEMEYARIIVEVGLVGLLGVLIMRLSFLWVVWQTYIRSRSRAGSLFPNLPAASMLALSLFFVGNILVFDHVACFYAWTVGVMTLAAFEAEAGRIRQPSRNAPRGAAPLGMTRPIAQQSRSAQASSVGA